MQARALPAGEEHIDLIQFSKINPFKQQRSDTIFLFKLVLVITGHNAPKIRRPET